MAKKKITKKKTVHVRAHPMHVPVSKKNPTGITIRDAHDRHINSLDIEEIKKIFAEYDRTKIVYPAKEKLPKHPDADKYDDLIAVWCDFYNKKFPPISKNIRQKDLKDPEIAIPVATRWIFRKQELARNTLKRNPTPEEIILEYKGLLKSSSQFKQNAVKKFKDAYEKLKQK